MPDKRIDHASVYTDFSGLNSLRSAAARDTPEARRETAQQFEALFIQMLLKNMRQASQGDELLGGSEVEMSRDMYDKQLSIELSKNGALGIGDLMLQQMGETDASGENPPEVTLKVSPKTAGNTSQTPDQPIDFIPGSGSSGHVTRNLADSGNRESPQDFIRQLQPDAEAIAQKLGTQAEAVLAIAALETGWGQHVIPSPDGTSSHNLFGIKADKKWNKDQVISTTLEFAGGVMQKRREPFRQYTSTQESMEDFADLLTQNPRYKTALAEADNPQHFIEELHKAGYATDPDYTEKALAVMHKIRAMTQDAAMLADKKTGKMSQDV